jgi:DNA-binding IclR family transcriptional regulator
LFYTRPVEQGAYAVGEVSSDLRALRLIAIFAARRQPLRLSEIAAELDVAVSSCYALVRRLVHEGYLFEVAGSKRYYPSGKLHKSTEIIAAHDPLRALAENIVTTLRDRINETVTFGQRAKAEVIYLYGAESTMAVHMAARVGSVRPLHATAMGKALISVMAPAERKQLFASYTFERLTAKTILDLSALEEDVSLGEKQGYFASCEESVDGAMAIAVPIKLNYSDYGLQIAGPVDRMRGKEALIAEALREEKERYAS